MLERRVEAATDELEANAEETLLRHPGLARTTTLLRAVQKKQSAEQVSLAASGAAFWLVISAIPTAAAAISLFGLVVTPARVATDLARLAGASPESLGSQIKQQLQHVAAVDHTSLSVSLIVSVVLAAWSASAGVYNLDRAIRYSFGLPRQHWLEARWRAMTGVLVVVGVVGLLALVVSVAGGHVPTVVLVAVGLPAALLALTIAIGLMYRASIGPTVGARQLLPGAAVAAAAVVCVLAGFAGYLAVSTRYTAVYGAFAGVAIGMVGTYLVVYAVLLGAVLTAVLRR